MKTAISLLQELMVSSNQSLPVYSFECTGTGIQPEFTCTVVTSNVTAVGTARNKKEAKQKAAENALVELNQGDLINKKEASAECPLLPCKEAPSLKLPSGYIPTNNYIGRLHEFASAKKIANPTYNELLSTQNSLFKVICKFVDYETVGEGTTKKQAKHIASYYMCTKISEDPPDIKDILTKVKIEMSLDEHDLAVKKKYEELSVAAEEKSLDNEVADYLKISDRYLAKLDSSYVTEVIQKDPFIVSIKKNGVSILGHGKTEKEALVRAFYSVNKILRERELIKGLEEFFS